MWNSEILQRQQPNKPDPHSWPTLVEMARRRGFAAEVQVKHCGTSKYETQQSAHDSDHVVMTSCHATQSMLYTKWCNTHTTNRQASTDLSITETQIISKDIFVQCKTIEYTSLQLGCIDCYCYLYQELIELVRVLYQLYRHRNSNMANIYYF